jgi:very-short-patch-repair endonuclease
LDARINFALQQNDVPVVKMVRVRNLGEEPLRDIELRISAEPRFGEGWSSRIAEIGPGATYNLNAIDICLSPAYLGALTERLRGELWFELTDPSEGGILLRRREPVELLARDEWSGLSSLPEILTAFVLPNHPATERVISSAAGLLQEWTGDPSLSGYQSKDPRRVFMTAAAIYGSLQHLELTYVNPPASFEEQGQRIRLPERVLSGRMATCLDVALLAAGCLEQAGLHALLVLIEGHAFTGVWLEDECFPDPTTDDPLRLRKRVDLKEIAVFDPTFVTARPSPSFEDAVAQADRWLQDTARFRCVIDVQRARNGRIRPLPERGDQAEAVSDAAAASAVDAVAVPDVTRLGIFPDSDGSSQDDRGRGGAATRLDRWRRKLLDLTLRNRLLNFRDTKKTLTLLCPDPSLFEDMLAQGESFQIRPRPADLGAADPRDTAVHLRRTGEDGVEALLAEEMKARRIHGDTTLGDLERRLVEIYRAARLGLEEGGASALYLAVGFLVWYESKSSEKRRLAPLLLIPVELHRKSARQGFALRQGDDDPRINVTLLELLKQDHGLTIPGLDPLPEDESGLDVPLILRSVRKAVRDIDRWDVVDDVRVGLFSFAKFLMWRDLEERADDLMKNPVVDHLVNRPDEPFDTGGMSMPRADFLDDELAPTDTFCPLPADSSQLAAVVAASQGMSFVLEGPPGTGKSQTITNLIAHCLTEGKTVLFVSEKMAALNVVHRRLEQVGLGRFCLELHSNKAHKRDVLEQLGASLQRFEAAGAEEWEREARRLQELRGGLNDYVRALHVRRSTGETVFKATSRLIGLRDAPRVELRWPDADALDAEALQRLRDLVARVATAGSACGAVQGHPWVAVRKDVWTPGWEEEVGRARGTLDAATAGVADRAAAVSERLGLGPPGWSFDTLEGMHELAGLLLEPPAPAPGLLAEPDWDAVRGRVGEWIKHGRIRDALREELRERFTDEISRLDPTALRLQLTRAEASWWPLSWWRTRPVRKALAGVALSAKAPPNDELDAVLGRAASLRKEQAHLDRAAEEARAVLGRHWNEGEAEWDGVAGVCDWSETLRGLAVRFAGEDFARAASLRDTWLGLATEGRDLLARDAPIGRQLVLFREGFLAFRDARAALAYEAELDVEQAWGSPRTADALGRVGDSLSRWRGGENRLRDWCAWRRARGEAVRENLGALVEAYEADAFGSDQLPAVFERSYTQWWLGAVTDEEPVLSRFFSPEHQRRIEQFRDVDQRYMELTRSVIDARLGERVPAGSSAVLPNSEMGILKRELGKKRRHMPMRQLFQKVPNLLPRLKPCLLMSPMSVAQYLDSGHPPFDLVVFDEASQIPVWDAVGAIARGRQAVIVGDPKQLPPTNFFQRAEDDEEVVEEDVVEDLESILDDCIGAQLPWLPLNWHYRSRHETLITFSNYHYYDNRLLTFPSASREGMGVSWCPVPDGIYDKGKSRTNRKEADAVVAEILRRLQDRRLCGLTIGVVTFSQAQQTLIEDLLDSARIDNPDLEPFFAEDALEPLFVKNLENVQGDERDVILFSICYGPDLAGKISMNFGPMNRDGGERRLNVAVTRARREVLVFSTLRADQIDLTRTRARGVRDLKEFLAYAEHGPSAIAEAVALDPEADFDSPFEEAVFDELVQRGWQVHKQVGCARYRIDLAVVDPESPGRYLLGVECDGANYHRARAARDRDKLREAVLSDLGWELHRVWSTDWWTNPDREVDKLEVALKLATERRAAAMEEPHPADPATEAPPPASPKEEPAQAPFAAVPEPPAPRLDFYLAADLGPAAGSGDDFYGDGAAEEIADQLTHVVRREGPISMDLAAKRVASTWGFDRVRARAVKRVRSLVSRAGVHLQSSPAGDFLWMTDTEPQGYAGFRVPDATGRGARQASELAPEEVANAALHLLEGHLSAPVDELVRETARLFGFQRVGRLVDERMRAGIETLVGRGAARMDGEMVVRVEGGQWSSPPGG